MAAPVINNHLLLARFRQLLRDLELQISIIYNLNKLVQISTTNWLGVQVANAYILSDSWRPRTPKSVLRFRFSTSIKYGATFPEEDTHEKQH